MKRYGRGAIAVTSNLFETMLFMCLDPQEEGPEEPSLFKSFSMYLMGEIGFTGKYKGNMKLFLPLEMAKRMAARFMGLEEEKASESQSMDTVRELCNMIGGKLSSLLDRKAVWDLTIPQIRPVSYQEMGAEIRPEGVRVDFDAQGSSPLTSAETVKNLDPMASLPLDLFGLQGVNPVRSRGMQATDKALGILKEYQKAIADPSVSLRQLSPVVQRLSKEVQDLNLLSDQLSPSDPLKEVLTRTGIVTAMEIERFNGGDYL